MTVRDTPEMGDLCWDNYWREFYVDLGSLVTGERVSWWLGALGDGGFGNASREDRLTVHRTPFEVGRDRIVLKRELIFACYRHNMANSYEEARRIYRNLAEEWAALGGTRLTFRRPQSRPTPY